MRRLTSRSSIRSRLNINGLSHSLKTATDKEKNQAWRLIDKIVHEDDSPTTLFMKPNRIENLSYNIKELAIVGHKL